MLQAAYVVSNKRNMQAWRNVFYFLCILMQISAIFLLASQMLALHDKKITVIQPLLSDLDNAINTKGFDVASSAKSDGDVIILTS